MYFNNSQTGGFRQEKDPMMNTASSPSQLSAFNSSLYAQQSGLGNMNFQQRTSSNAPFARNAQGHVTPTSLSGGPTLPFGLQAQQQLQQQQQQQQPQQQQASPNSRLYSMSRGASSMMPRSNAMSSALLSSGTNSLTSMSSMSGMASMANFGRGDLSQPSLDLSDFPSLGNRSAPLNPVTSARSYVGMVSKPPQDPAPEFQIQQEDFPALPGAQNPPTANSTDNARKTPTNPSVAGSYEQALSKDGAKYPGDKTVGSLTKRGIQTHQDGTVSNIPAGMVTDQFGMVGLLTYIRAAETDPNLVALAPGIDLATLGLNLNSPDTLYSTFQSPWADAPCRPQDIDFHVPSEYLTNIFIRDKLAPIKLNRYGDDLLFFLFYMNGGDVLQLAAAAELYNRDWRYHKEERIWIARAPGMEPMVKTNSYERGTYCFFDAPNWRKVTKEFHLEYDKLEERPHLPQSFHNNNQQQPTVLAH